MNAGDERDGLDAIGGARDGDDELSRHGPLFAREGVLAHLRSFLVGGRSLSHGWVLLLGGPGIGKSAILAHLIQTFPEPKPPHHFLRRGVRGLDRPEELVQRLCTQIERLYPGKLTADVPLEKRLGELLSRVSHDHLKPGNDQLILIIDGLDEAAQDRHGQNTLTRFLPRTLPAGVIIVCSSRPSADDQDWLAGLDRVHPMNLDEDWTHSNEEACRLFWEHHANEFSPSLDAAFIEEAVHKSEGNILYAVKLRDWLRAQPVAKRAVAAIPYGLGGLLTQIWNEIQALELGQRNLVIQGLGAICAARAALPDHLLREHLGWTTEQAEVFLRVTRPFLLQERADWCKGEVAYRLFHEYFREFIAGKLGVSSLRQHHRRYAEVLAAWPPEERDKMRRAYALRHAVSHRIEAGDLKGAFRLCVDVEYLEIKCRECGVAAVERDLEATSLAVDGDASLDLAAILSAIRAEAHRLEATPGALRANLYARLCCTGWSGERIEGVLRFPKGAPALRLLHSVALGPTLLRAFLGHKRPVVACVVLPDGERFLTASADHTIRLWSFGSSEYLAVLPGHEGELTAIAVTPDATLAISGSVDGSVRLWNLARRQCVDVLGNGGRSVTAVAITGDGRRVVVGSDNGALTVWDIAERRVITTLVGHSDYITACLVGPRDEHLVTASRDGSLRVWDLDAEARVRRLPLEDPAATPAGAAIEGRTWFTALTLTPDGSEIIAATEDGALTRWELAHGGMVQRCDLGQGRVNSCVALPEGHLLCGMSDGTLLVVHLASERCVCSVEAHAGAVFACAVTVDGRRILSASHDRKIKLWELGSLVTLVSHEKQAGPVTACALTPDGSKVVSASEDREVRSWNVKTGACIAVFRGHADLVTTCAISADARYALSGARDGQVWGWLLDAPDRGELLDGHAEIVSGCALASDGSIVTASRDRTIVSRRPEARRDRQRLELAEPVDGFVVSLNGVYALSFCSRGAAEMWDLRSLRCEGAVQGFASPIRSAAISCSGRYAVFGLENGEIEVRGVQQGQRLGRLPAHAGRVLGCAVSPDERWVASVSEDRTMRVSDLHRGNTQAILHGTSRFRCVTMTDRVICAGDEEGNLWMIAFDVESSGVLTATALLPGVRPAPRRSPPPRRWTPTKLPSSVMQGPGFRSRQVHESSYVADLHARLREALTRLFSTMDRAHMIAADAGLDHGWINRTGNLAHFWHQIIEEAYKRRRLPELVRIALKDYPEDTALLEIAGELARSRL